MQRTVAAVLERRHATTLSEAVLAERQSSAAEAVAREAAAREAICTAKGVAVATESARKAATLAAAATALRAGRAERELKMQSDKACRSEEAARKAVGTAVASEAAREALSVANRKLEAEKAHWEEQAHAANAKAGEARREAVEVSAAALARLEEAEEAERERKRAMEEAAAEAARLLFRKAAEAEAAGKSAAESARRAAEEAEAARRAAELAAEVRRSSVEDTDIAFAARQEETDSPQEGSDPGEGSNEPDSPLERRVPSTGTLRPARFRKLRLGLPAASAKLSPPPASRSRSEAAPDPFSAVLAGNFAALTAALEADPSLLDEPRSSGPHVSRTLLHCAAVTGHAPIVAELLRRGAKRDAQDIRGATALTLAREARFPVVVAMLQTEARGRGGGRGGGGASSAAGQGLSSPSCAMISKYWRLEPPSAATAIRGGGQCARSPSGSAVSPSSKTSPEWLRAASEALSARLTEPGTPGACARAASPPASPAPPPNLRPFRS